MRLSRNPLRIALPKAGRHRPWAASDGPPPPPSLLGPALWRSRRGRQFLLQLAAALVILAVIAMLGRNMSANLARQNLNLSWDFLGQTAGVDLSETLIPYSLRDSLGRMIFAGALNSLLVSVVCTLLATVIGLVVGVMRVSANPLLRLLTGSYVDVMRNTPLLLQMLLFYTILMMMPPPRQALSWGDMVFVSLRGVQLPGLIWVGTAQMAALGLGFGLLAGLALLLVTGRKPGADQGQDQAVRRRGGLALLVGLGTGLLVLAGLGGFDWQIPVLSGFNFTGGLALTPEFTALTLAVSLYTGAFIAELVRGGIQGVAKGQREAGASLGLSRLQVMRFVVLPQALLAIIPPVTTQYVGIIKASSLAVVIGYPDFFYAISSASNLSGHSIESVTFMLGGYVFAALAVAWVMNHFNATLVRKAKR